MNLPEEQECICLLEPWQVRTIRIARLRSHVYFLCASAILSQGMAEYA